MSSKYYHPYEPYPIQLQFMDALTELLNKDYKVGLFESPTGTGKTLSLICSSMTWLRKKERETSSGLVQKSMGKDSEEKEEEEEEDDDDEPEWVKQSFQNMHTKSNNDKAEAYERFLDDLSKSVKNAIDDDKVDRRRATKIRKITVGIENEDDQFAPDDYNSDKEEDTDTTPITDKNTELNEQVKSLLRQFDQRHNKQDYDPLKQDIKVIFASRTHSQLSQFSSQLKLPFFPSSLSSVDHQHLKYLPLGSRKQLCIHEKVSKIKDATLMNEACLDLQNSTDSSKKQSCPYFPSSSNPQKQMKSTEFKDRLFTQIHDIEELPPLGTKLGTCPYYSVRKGIPAAEIITLPYQLLLQKSSRETLGLDLKNCVVIVDEAHNLIDTITSIYSVTVKLSEIIQCKDSLKVYLSKFSRRMNGGNRINLLKLMKMIDLVINYSLKQEKESGIKPGKVININDMFENTTGDLLNVHKLDKYLSTTKIGYKIQSYIDKLEKEKDQMEQNSKVDDGKQSRSPSSASSTPVLFKVIDFLKSIANPSSEGKFFFDLTTKSSSTAKQTFESIITLNYMLLDPSQMFKDIVEQSKCVILAGGTMEPVSDFTDYLFPYVHQDKIMKFGCDHIIPRENLKVFPVTGYRGKRFEFTFDKRNDMEMIDSVGHFICDLIERTPNGVVVFLPSYKYLSGLIEIWKNSGIYRKMDSIKKIHYELPGASTVELLENYTKDATASKAANNGAILFAVVGGKLSEGINFNDDLARAVVIIGLPYPNLFSGEIINKRKYIEAQTLKKTKGDQKAANEAMRQFYENLCMKAVNQSIGRSIRHIDDYSTIYLLDLRYGGENDRVQGKLSNWIRTRISDCDDWAGAQVALLKETEEFFKEKRLR